MAWRSSGTTNDEMVDNLKRFRVISTLALEQSFRNVDRKFFVPSRFYDMAHVDQPLKDGNIHLSAPHIYGSALDALELKPDSSLSFLNVGSGSGYVSCIVADLLGVHSSHYGVEIHQDAVEHSQMAMQRWTEARAASGRTTPLPQVQMLQGNALQISHIKGEGAIGFDRIYVGASVDRRHLSKLTRLLRPGGILVGPVEDELVKVVRIGQTERTSDAMDDSGEFSQQVISSVRFASLATTPKKEVILPSPVWEPQLHHYYPDSFRSVCKELLMCNQSEYYQPLTQVRPPEARINLAATLPKAIWMEIMAFTHRSWFEPPQTEETFLRLRLAEEQAETAKANQARLEAEARLHMVERERDVYRLLARRWQSRLQTLLRQRAGGEQDTNASDADIDNAAAVLLSGQGPVAIFGLGSMLRHLQDNSEDEDTDDNDSTMEENRFVAMEDDEEDDDDYDDDDSHVEFHEASSGDTFDLGSENGDFMDESEDVEQEMISVSPAPAKAIASRRQVRTISISSDDL